jgi:aminopeptidase N
MAESNDNSLGSYIKNHGARLAPAAFGIASPRRRTPGLRREEIAQRANVSARRRVRLRLVRVFAFAVTAGMLCDALAEPATKPTTAPTAGAPGLGDAVQPGLGNGGYEIRHYRLDLRFSPDLATYTAATTLDARTTQALSRFDLDLAGTEVVGVSVDNRPAKWSRTAEKLQVTPATSIPAASDFTVRVRVKAATPDTKQMAREGIISFGMVRDGSWIMSICQPAGAHRIAALADHPAQKAPATITIAAPTGLNAISNGDLVDTRPDPDDHALTVRRFETGRKLAPELLQIGVGPFTVVTKEGPGGIELRYALPTDQVKAIEPQLAVVPEIIGFLEDQLGKFPLRTCGIYAPPLGGELETQSAILIGADQLEQPAFADNGVDTILAHEFSHEYFGNSVSPLRWSDLWLNEGHAVYYQALWDESRGRGSLEAEMHRVYAREDTDLQRYGPVAAPKLTAFHPASSAPYGPTAYGGGALALFALRQNVGQPTFEKIERAWVREHDNGVAGTEDYIALAGRVAGRDLGPFLRPWLYGDHVPPMPAHPDWRHAPPLPTKAE